MNSSRVAVYGLGAMADMLDIVSRVRTGRT